MKRLLVVLLLALAVRPCGFPGSGVSRRPGRRPRWRRARHRRCPPGRRRRRHRGRPGRHVRGRGIHIATVPASHGGASVAIALLLAAVIGGAVYALATYRRRGPAKSAEPTACPLQVRRGSEAQGCLAAAPCTWGPPARSSLSKAGRYDRNDREGPCAVPLTAGTDRHSSARAGGRRVGWGYAGGPSSAGSTAACSAAARRQTGQRSRREPLARRQTMPVRARPPSVR